MFQKIALFNHKGGVSKTTTTFNLGWMLSSRGKTVILVDTDPQCNLTGMALGFSTKQELESIYSSGQHIKAGLAPAFESRPKAIEAVDCLPIAGQENLFLLPGHVGLAEYEVTLGIAQELSGSIQTLQNLPGAIHELIRQTAEKFNADYVLVDMSPSLGSINQNLLMTSDFFILPTNPDFFSVMAIDSLVTILPRWSAWADKASALPILQMASYPFPKITPRFLGTVVQNYRKRKGEEPTAAFQEWMDKIESAVSTRLVAALQSCNMMLPAQAYFDQRMNSDFCLAKISNFNSLIARSQDCQTPVFDLTSEQIKQTGIVLQRTLKSQSNFKDTFNGLADRVIGLTSHAGSN